MNTPFDKQKLALSTFDEKIGIEERSLKFRETALQKAKEEKLHAEKLWATISHHSEEDLEIIRSLISNLDKLWYFQDGRREFYRK